MNPDALIRLGRAVADQQDSLLARTEQASGLDSQLAALHAARDERRRARVRLARTAIVTAMVAMVAAVAFVLRSHEPSLAFVVGPAERSGAVGDWVAAVDEPLPLRFSDGSLLRLDRTARGRVGTVVSRGATFVLDRGNVHVEVVHRKGNDWHVTAGPFDVHVTGTTFDANWDPSRDELTIAMKEGRVVVTGACAKNGISVAGGNTHRFSCPPPEPSVTADETPHAAPPNGPASPVTSSSSSPDVVARPERKSSEVHREGPVPLAISPSSVPSPSSAPSPSGSPSGVGSAPTEARDPRTLIARGAYSEAIQQAERIGYDSVCSSSTAQELEALGDAARLAGKPKRAAEAYTAIRSRFPSTPEAATSAFQLGRLAHLGSPTSSEAKRWFGTYLIESPNGSFAAQALGRVLEIESADGSPTARDTAARYLARFPAGAHARLAAETLGTGHTEVQ
jgi:transmembrane sensor